MSCREQKRESPQLRKGALLYTPRVWGRRKQGTRQRKRNGNTPTCVGKTRCSPVNVDINQKHPHVRGEDCPRSRHITPSLETPPRAWGRPEQAQASLDASRNTPTCVGKTGGHCARCVKGQKHPHVRGEDVANIFKQFSAVETPPRAWGRHCRFIDDTRCRENVKVLTFF